MAAVDCCSCLRKVNTHKNMFVGRCFNSLADCFYGTGEWAPPNPIPASQVIPDVILDTSCMGKKDKPTST